MANFFKYKSTEFTEERDINKMENVKLIAEITNQLLHDCVYFIVLGFNVLHLICF